MNDFAKQVGLQIGFLALIPLWACESPMVQIQKPVQTQTSVDYAAQTETHRTKEEKTPLVNDAEERADTPIRITGSYLYCREVAPDTPATNEARVEIQCRLADAQSAQTLDLSRHAYTFSLMPTLALGGIRVEALALTDPLSWHARVLVSAADGAQLREALNSSRIRMSFEESANSFQESSLSEALAREGKSSSSIPFQNASLLGSWNGRDSTGLMHRFTFDLTSAQVMILAWAIECSPGRGDLTLGSVVGFTSLDSAWFQLDRIPVAIDADTGVNCYASHQELIDQKFRYVRIGSELSIVTDSLMSFRLVKE